MFKPVNRYIIVDVPEENPHETTSGILLPEDYNPTKEKHITVKVRDWAKDVRFAAALIKNYEIIVDRKMIEEITINNEKISMILDNYVIGIIETKGIYIKYE